MRNLLLGARDALARVGRARGQLAQLAGEGCLGTLQGQYLRPAHELLRQQSLLVLQLFAEQRHALLRRLRLRGIAADAFAEARDLLSQHLLFARRLQAARPQLDGLALEDAADLGVLGFGSQLGGHRERRPAVDLGLQARLHDEQAMVPQHEAAQPAAGGRGVEAKERLADFDQVALLHQHLAQDAAFQMLDVLVLPRGHEGAGHDDCAFQGCKRRPHAEAADAHQQNGGADQDRPADARRHAAMPFVDAGAGRHGASSALGAAVAGKAGGVRAPSQAAGGRRAFGLRTRRRTSLGGPNASARPARRMRTLSTILRRAGRWVMTMVVTPFCLRAHECFGQGLFAGGVEIGVGFVQHDHGGLAEEGAGERDALLLPARQRRAVALQDWFHTRSEAGRSCRARPRSPRRCRWCRPAGRGACGRRCP